jgi:hypothetical protein
MLPDRRRSALTAADAGPSALSKGEWDSQESIESREARTSLELQDQASQRP